MYEKLTKELNSFLIDYAITGKEIFNDWILKLIGINPQQKNTAEFWGFLSSNSDSKDKLSFNPSGFDLFELGKLLNLFNIDQSIYRIGQRLTVDPELVFEHILPRFKEYVALLSQQELRIYQISSKSALETQALANIKTSSEKLLKILDKTENNVLTDEKRNDLCNILFLTKGILSSMSSDNNFCEFVFFAQNSLMQFMKDTPLFYEYENDRYHELQSLVNELNNAFSAYAKFNRVEIVRAVKQLFPDLEKAVNRHQITISKTDILEHTLLNMAGVTVMPTNCKFKIDMFDRTRVMFILTGMTSESSQQLLALFHSLGDDSATCRESFDRGNYYGRSTESCERAESAMLESYSDSRADKPIVKVHHFSVDGEVMVHTIFPQFKEQLATSAPEFLKPYQEKSREYIEYSKKLTSKTISVVGSSTLFNPSTSKIMLGGLQDDNDVDFIIDDDFLSQYAL